MVDIRIDQFDSWGQYTYFFLGTPTWWGVKKNLGVTVPVGHPGPDKVLFEVRGQDVVTEGRLVFYRPDDRVVVIRGGYRGPARADPLL